jgi:hypothetical protein
MSILLEGLGLERIAREALIVLAAGLNAELDHQTTVWSPLDEHLATYLGNDIYSIGPLEHVEPSGFYLGHKKSAILFPPEKYPMVSVMAFQSSTDPTAGGDQYDGALANMFVEFIVKGATEEQTNSRAQRTADAVMITLAGNATLNGLVQTLSPPNVIISDVQDRTLGKDSQGLAEDGSGAVWWWQGGRLDYRMPSMHVTRKQQTNAYALPAGLFTGMGIDQLP